MTCCKAEEFEWCSELEADCRDDDGNRYCVFHAPVGCKGEIDKEGFNSLVFRRIDEAVCSGCSCELSGAIYQWSISFKAYSNEQPLPPLDFEHAIFNEMASFNASCFSGDVNFKQATFKNGAFFLGANFNGKAILSETNFNKGAIFKQTTFKEGTIFKESSFSETTNFMYTSFGGEANYHGVNFNGKAFFRGASFNEMANFWGSSFRDEANFMQASFRKEAIFREVDFNDEVLFWETSFNGETKFGSARFSKNVNFMQATFKGKADFLSAIFGGKSDFWDSNFRDTVSFTWCKFKKEVSFKEATFKEIVFLRSTVFGDTAKFCNNIVNSYMIFDSVAMAHVSFIGTDVSKFKFNAACEWPEYKTFFNLKRQAIYDDLILTRKSEPEKYKFVALVYRQLKQGQKESHNEAGASRWHYGEKEMFRKERWWRRWPISITFWYWLSSGYGERPVRAGVFLVGLFIFLVGFLNIVGLTDGTIPVKGFSGPFNMTSFLILIKTSLQYALFAKAPIFEPIGNLGHIALLVITRLILPIQATLFGFALRNRFRR